ncbi:MAG: N-acetyl-anhydromuranmyl-L-alanine amidase [Gammaproteobacteria bacterium]|nr:MAG: N-acetyl-anhydromuranmyl-L-alanine amidase [Gammaproteobacteria bacterium]
MGAPDSLDKPPGIALRLDAQRRWFSPARRVPSPNQDARPPGCGVELVVIHGISLPPGVFGSGDIDRLFTNRLDPAAHPFYREIAGLRVSAHLLIDRDGALTQYVPLDRRAWHAGASRYCGRERCNDFSVGIELEGTDTVPYTDAQYARLAEVMAVLFAAFPTLHREAVVGHCDIAPGRKTDPGPAFDWARLDRELARHGPLPT